MINKPLLCLRSSIVLIAVWLIYCFSVFNKHSKQSIISGTSENVYTKEILLLTVNNYQKLSTKLCEGKVIDIRDNEKNVFNPQKVSCPQNGIVSVAIGGRTANLIWEYAAVWAAARSTGLEPYMPCCAIGHLSTIFENLQVPTFDKIAHCSIATKVFVRSVSQWTNASQNIIFPKWTSQPALISQWRDDITKEFTFKQALRDKAQETLNKIVKIMPSKNHTFIAVHVRRTDYIGYLKRKYNMNPVTPDFFSNAMNYFNSRYPNCIFIYISDDPKWCDQHFGKLDDVVIAGKISKNSGSEDLALMAACNHTIFDYGTYGEWGSILANGETVCNNMIQNIRWRTAKNFSWVLMN